MPTLTRLRVALLATLFLPFAAAAENSQSSSTPTPSPSPRPVVSGTDTATATRPTPFTTFDSASPAVRDSVTAATAAAQTAVSSLEEAIRLGIVQPVTTALPNTLNAPVSGQASSAAVLPSVEALPPTVTRASTAIVAESRNTRATELAGREAAVSRLRQATTDTERQRLIEELRTASGQRLESQREDARLVRDRLRQLRDLTTLTRPAGN